VDGRARFSPDVLARYAADAAYEVPGVRGLVVSQLHRHRGVRVVSSGGRLSVEVHLSLDAGASIPAVGREVQERVAEYLVTMTDARPASVDVVVDEIGGA
jgi:uncharacterized alkaline shock family protein YloU